MSLDGYYRLKMRKRWIEAMESGFYHYTQSGWRVTLNSTDYWSPYGVLCDMWPATMWLRYSNCDWSHMGLTGQRYSPSVLAAVGLTVDQMIKVEACQTFIGAVTLIKGWKL